MMDERSDEQDDDDRDGPLRLLADAMLGDLARWLRILGEDCAYVQPSWTDAEVLRVVREERRVLVSRDVGLVRAAHAVGRDAILVELRPVQEVLEVVYRTLGARPLRSRRGTRCSSCNGALVEVAPPTRAAIAERASAARAAGVPDDVVARQEAVWVCRECGQVFWRGGHWDRIEGTRARLIAALGGGASAPDPLKG